MTTLFGRSLAEEIMKLRIATREEIRGCDLREIEELKERQGIKWLPQVYVDYLLTVGKQAGSLDVGTDCFYPVLLNLKEWATTLLEENGMPFSLPADAFIFWMHQGYQFTYFLTGDEVDDPPVFYYTEDPEDTEEKPQTRHKHLSEFLTLFIADSVNKEAQKSFLKKHGLISDDY